MATKKLKQHSESRASSVHTQLGQHSNAIDKLSSRLGILEAKLGSTVLELGKANKRIDNLTTGFTQGLANAAKPVGVSDKVWHESEILKRWDNYDRTKLIELLIWNL